MTRYYYKVGAQCYHLDEKCTDFQSEINAEGVLYGYLCVEEKPTSMQPCPTCAVNDEK